MKWLWFVHTVKVSHLRIYNLYLHFQSQKRQQRNHARTSPTFLETSFLSLNFDSTFISFLRSTIYGKRVAMFHKLSAMDRRISYKVARSKKSFGKKIVFLNGSWKRLILGKGVKCTIRTLTNSQTLSKMDAVQGAEIASTSAWSTTPGKLHFIGDFPPLRN